MKENMLGDVIKSSDVNGGVIAFVEDNIGVFIPYVRGEVFPMVIPVKSEVGVLSRMPLFFPHLTGEGEVKLENQMLIFGDGIVPGFPLEDMSADDFDKVREVKNLYLNFLSERENAYKPSIRRAKRLLKRKLPRELHMRKMSLLVWNNRLVGVTPSHIKDYPIVVFL